ADCATGPLLDPARDGLFPVALLAGYGDVFAPRQLVDVERRVDPHAAELELVECRRAVLLEIVKRDVVGIVRTAARELHLGVAELRGTEDRLPPVRAGAARHDQR